MEPDPQSLTETASSFQDMKHNGCMTGENDSSILTSGKENNEKISTFDLSKNQDPSRTTNICTEQKGPVKTRKLSKPLMPQKQLLQPQFSNHISKRPELYSGLSPWDFLVDSCNIPETIEDGDPNKYPGDAMRISQKRLQLTIERLEEIIVKFQNVVQETCILDKTVNLGVLQSKLLVF